MLELDDITRLMGGEELNDFNKRLYNLPVLPGIRVYRCDCENCIDYYIENTPHDGRFYLYRRDWNRIRFKYSEA